MKPGPKNKELSKAKVREIVRCLQSGELLTAIRDRMHIGPVVIRRNIVRLYGEDRYKKLMDLHLTHRFKKGVKPWNTGVKGYGGWLKKHQFKEGQPSCRRKPVGTTVVWRKVLSKGLWYGRGSKGKKTTRIRYIKVGGRKWITFARHIWQRAYGPIPKRMCIVHLDRDHLNDELDNLALMTRVQYFNYLDVRFPEHKKQRLIMLSESLKGLRRKTKVTIKKYWGCPHCGYDALSKFGRCPKCNSTSCCKAEVNVKCA